MEEYILSLFNQFKISQGMSNLAKYEYYKNAFSDWLSNQQRIKDRYVQLLIAMNMRDGLVAELGKGINDSVVPDLCDLSIDAIAITPYANTFKNTNVTACDGELVICQDGPIITYENSKDMYSCPNCNNMLDTSIKTLITQLPHNDSSLKALMESSRCNNDIVIGAYGNTNDKDALFNYQLIRRIKDSIENQYCVGCEEVLTTENGTYNHIILSSQKRLELCKTHFWRR